jgi:hypothetical protein
MNNLILLAGLCIASLEDELPLDKEAVKELIDPNACKYMPECATRKNLGREYCYVSKCDNCQTFKFYERWGI